jgi:rare lipoprotein A
MTAARVAAAARGATAALLAAVLAAACIAPPPRPERPVPELPGPDHEHPEISAGRPPAGPPGTAPPAGGPGNPPFYEVMGERYHVMPDSEGYLEQGVASWYGREFHGRRTSNGEKYDMYAMTAAHKTLPLPTDARVTNLATGKSIVVRINDRGPFKKGRIIDLSYAAARELGFVTAGTALVEVEALSGPAGAGPWVGAPAAPRAMYVQVGAFGQQRNAEELRRRLEQQGFANVVIRYDAGGEPALWRVRIGPVADAAEYDAVANRVVRLQISEPRLVVEQAGAAPGAPAAAGPGLPGG